jgi:hypothetical protein
MLASKKLFYEHKYEQMIGKANLWSAAVKLPLSIAGNLFPVCFLNH